MQILRRVPGRLVTVTRTHPEAALVFPDVVDPAGVFQRGPLGLADDLVAPAAERRLENRDQRGGAGLHLAVVSVIRFVDGFCLGNDEADVDLTAALKVAMLGLPCRLAGWPGMVIKNE